MQEKADPVLHAQLAQFLGQRDQVIVVHPDQVVGLDQRRQHARQIFVDRDIALELLAMKFDQAELVMQQRPQRAIGIAQVVILIVRRVQIDRGEGDIALLEDRRLFRPGFADLARPAEPDAAVGFQGFAQRRFQSAGPPRTGGGDADTIRDGDQSAQNASSQCLLSRMADTMMPTIE